MRKLCSEAISITVLRPICDINILILVHDIDWIRLWRPFMLIYMYVDLNIDSCLMKNNNRCNSRVNFFDDERLRALKLTFRQYPAIHFTLYPNAPLYNIIII